MGMDQFVTEPKTYLKSHTQVILSQNMASMAAVRADPDVPVPGGGISRQYFHRTGGPFITLLPFISKDDQKTKDKMMRVHNVIGRRIGIIPGMTRQYNPSPSSVDLGIRWLPHELGVVAYMEIDAAARFIGTGKLTGCTVAVGSVNGQLYYFHAFRPDSAAGAGFLTRQRAMIDDVAGRLGITDTKYAEIGIDYDGEGFGCSSKKNGVWRFYIYGTSTGPKKFAEY